MNIQADATKILVDAVQRLSLARDMATVMGIVRHAARELTGADGATFILREGDQCHYADEDAIGPLWKGKRFPMSACISGWVMLNKRPAVIKDIYADARVPADAYRPTFVQSLAMVPVRTAEPVGAIGNYWAKPHEATGAEVELLQALADSTSIALENVQLYNELDQRVKERTAQLELANKELEAFSYSVSHDLRSPLRIIEGFGGLLHDAADLDDDSREFLLQIRDATAKMNALIDDLLRFSRVVRSDLQVGTVDLSQLAHEVVAVLRQQDPDRVVDVRIEPEVKGQGDLALLRVVLENLFSNAWKYTSKKAQAQITFGADEQVYFIEDDGVGFDMAHASRLFDAFQRLHAESDFPGTGVGLATVERIIRKHGGRIWAEAAVGKGARFSFTLG